MYRPDASTDPPLDSSTDQLKPAAWRELSPEMDAWKSTSPPREVVAAAGTMDSVLPEVSGPTAPTSPLHPWVRTAAASKRRRVNGTRIQDQCARSLGRPRGKAESRSLESVIRQTMTIVSNPA